jgi:hypothetical protein
MTIIVYFIAFMLFFTILSLINTFYQNFFSIKAYNFSLKISQDLFVLFIQLYILKWIKNKTAPSILLRVFWPFLLLLGLSGIIFFTNFLLTFRAYEMYYKPPIISMYYPFVYFSLIVIYGLILRYISIKYR